MTRTLTKLKTGSTAPVSVAEIKTHLRIDHSDDDSVLAELIDTAIQHIEDLVGHALRPTPYRLDLDQFPRDEQEIIELDIYIDSVDSVQYEDADGVTQTMPSADYDVDDASLPGRIIRTANEWPDGSDVKINFTSAVPKPAKQAIKLLVGHWYEQREASSDQTVNTIPMGVHALVQQIRGVLVH
jgi:uncharacterized phiE125 gp8 family phage protein